MHHPRNTSTHSAGNAPASPNWLKRFAVALAVTGVIGTVLVVTLAVMAVRFVGDAVDYVQTLDLATMESRMAEAALDLDQRQREIIAPLLERLKNEGLTPPQREDVTGAIMEALTPEQRERFESWKNIGAAGTQGLDGLMASVLRWLEELGVPVGLLRGDAQHAQ